MPNYTKKRNCKKVSQDFVEVLTNIDFDLVRIVKTLFYPYIPFFNLCLRLNKSLHPFPMFQANHKERAVRDFCTVLLKQTNTTLLQLLWEKRNYYMVVLWLHKCSQFCKSPDGFQSLKTKSPKVSSRKYNAEAAFHGEIIKIFFLCNHSAKTSIHIVNSTTMGTYLENGVVMTTVYHIYFHSKSFLRGFLIIVLIWTAHGKKPNWFVISTHSWRKSTPEVPYSWKLSKINEIV